LPISNLSLLFGTLCVTNSSIILLRLEVFKRRIISDGEQMDKDVKEILIVMMSLLALWMLGFGFYIFKFTGWVE